MLRISRLEVPHYRQLAGVEPFRLAKPTVVVGPNGIGKSTLIRALVFLLSGTVSAQDRVAGKLTVCGEFVDSDGSAIRLRRRLGDDGGVRLEQWRMVPAEVELRGVEAFGVDALKEAIDRYVPGYSGKRNARAPMIAALEEHADGLPKVGDWAPADSSITDSMPLEILFASTEEPDPEEEVRRSLDATFKAFRSTETFRTRLEELEREANSHLEEAGKSIRDTVHQRCADLGEPELKAEVAIANTFRGVSLTVGETEAKRPLDSLGAGERRRITLAVWEATAARFQRLDEEAEGPIRQRVVIYDEPDTHLDYFRQRELMSLLLAQASGPNDCVVVATHSQNLVDGVDPDSIVALRETESGESNAVVFLGGDINEHIADLSMSLGVSNSALLNERCFVVVEGASEAAALPILYRHCRGRRHQADGIVFLAVDGNGSALKVAALLKEIGRTVHVVVDRDCTTHEQTKKLFGSEALKRHGLDGDLKLLGDEEEDGVQEFEGLFSDDQWCSALNTTSPRVDGKFWVVSDIAEMRTKKKFSAALEAEVYSTSGEGANKPSMAAAVAEQAVRDDNVPDQLVTVFEAISA